MDAGGHPFFYTNGDLSPWLMMHAVMMATGSESPEERANNIYMS